MSSIWNRFSREEAYYPDGITKITDPLWDNICLECGHRFLSCTCTCGCPVCGSGNAERKLGGVPYARAAEERGVERQNQGWAVEIRRNQSKSV